jgi:hypothetical protein
VEDQGCLQTAIGQEDVTGQLRKVNAVLRHGRRRYCGMIRV